MIRSAWISECGQYRYHLLREWNPHDAKLTFCMLNPSTADGSVDDATIRRCMAFAKREGFGGIVVVNLFALRSTDSAALRTHPDPIGPQGDAVFRFLAKEQQGRKVVLGWGADPAATPERVRAVTTLLREGGCTLRCLGITKDGHPRHPLYLRSDTPVVAWMGVA